MRNEPLIEARDLGVYFQLKGERPEGLKGMLLELSLGSRGRTLWALDGIDLTCHQGQVVGLIGPNGAGKSTLCLVLSQVLTPDRGEVVVRGKVSPLLSLGAGFSVNLSGRDNIMLYAALLGISRRVIAERFDEIVDYSGLGDFIHEPLRHYSAGMITRLGFSVVTALEPEILILDEVMSVGDKAFREKSRKTIERMLGQSKLIIIASHETATMRDLCTHCLWIQEGKVARYGDAGPVLDEYERSRG